MFVDLYSSILSCQAMISSNEKVMTVSPVVVLDMFWLSFSDWTWNLTEVLIIINV